MSDNNETDVMQSSAEGTALSEANYLDTHYEAAREAYEACARFVGFQKGWSILDAGAGGGSFIPLISEMLGADGKITALDLDAENIATIERRQAANQFSCPVKTHQGSVTELPFEDNSFDAVWCANVQQYLTDEELSEALAEFKRVVRPSGTIAVKDVDAGVLLLGRDILAGQHLNEGMRAHPDFSVMVKGWFRMLQLPTHYRAHGIEPVKYKTHFVEWQHPVETFARPYLESVVPSIGHIASMLKLPDNEAAHWKRFADASAQDVIFENADFYCREGHAVAIGRKPA